MRQDELQAIREQYLPHAVASVEAEVIVNLADEVERLRAVMALAYEGARDNQRSWPERANKAAALLGIELGKCICGIGDVSSLSCPKHGLFAHPALEADAK